MKKLDIFEDAKNLDIVDFSEKERVKRLMFDNAKLTDHGVEVYVHYYIRIGKQEGWSSVQFVSRLGEMKLGTEEKFIGWGMKKMEEVFNSPPSKDGEDVEVISNKIAFLK